MTSTNERTGSSIPQKHCRSEGDREQPKESNRNTDVSKGRRLRGDQCSVLFHYSFLTHFWHIFLAAFQIVLQVMVYGFDAPLPSQKMNTFTLDECNAILRGKFLSKCIKSFALLTLTALAAAAVSSGKGVIMFVASYLKDLSLVRGGLQ